jgi:hypothetical protein
VARRARQAQDRSAHAGADLGEPEHVEAEQHRADARRHDLQARCAQKQILVIQNMFWSKRTALMPGATICKHGHPRPHAAAGCRSPGRWQACESRAAQHSEQRAKQAASNAQCMSGKDNVRGACVAASTSKVPCSGGAGRACVYAGVCRSSPRCSHMCAKM